MANIGIDLDGVVTNSFHKSVYDWAREKLPEVSNYQSFWQDKQLLRELPWDILTQYPLFYQKYSPDPRVIRALHRLSERNTLYYITNRDESLLSTTNLFARRWDIPQYENTFFVEGSKSPLVRKFRLDCFVDDKVEVCLELRTLTRVYMVEQPWNEPIAGVERIEGLWELEEWT